MSVEQFSPRIKVFSGTEFDLTQQTIESVLFSNRDPYNKGIGRVMGVPTSVVFNRETGEYYRIGGQPIINLEPRVSILELINRSRSLFRYNAPDQFDPCLKIRCKRPDGGGVRGSIDISSVTLTEGSPAFYGSFLDFTAGSLDIIFQFSVLSAGEGDWFEFSFGGENLFSGLLSDYALGEAYEVTIPGTLLAGRSGYALFGLHSFGPSDSSVMLFDAPRVDVGPNGAVPEPATWLMMLVGFGGIGYSMRRRRKTKFNTLAEA